MLTKWTQGLEEDEAKEIKNLFNQASKLRKRLDTILEKEIKARYKDMMLSNYFEDPKWELRQVDRLAQIKALTTVKNLICDKTTTL